MNRSLDCADIQGREKGMNGSLGYFNCFGYLAASSEGGGPSKSACLIETYLLNS